MSFPIAIKGFCVSVFTLVFVMLLPLVGSTQRQPSLMERRYVMHTKRVVITLLPLLVGSMLAWPAMGQSTGPVVFDSEEDALSALYSCNGAGDTPLTVAQSTTDGSGSNATQASNVSAAACGGQSLFSAQSASESTSAQDSVTQDDGAGSSQEQSVTMGGVLTYDTKTDVNNCSTPDGTNISCSDTTTISNLYFAGQHITGSFNSPTTFSAIDAQVLDPACTGVATFTGTLTIAYSTSQVSPDGQSGTMEMAPLKLDGTETCIGLQLGSMTFSLKDSSEIAAYQAFPDLPGLEFKLVDWSVKAN
jgi:hypothetical protein